MGKREDAAEFDRVASDLREGRIGQNEFVRRSREKWRRTAAYVFPRWRRKLPAWVEQADVEQELLMLAIEHVYKFEPSRANGKGIGLFVTWGAIHRLQRVLDHWRGASLTGNHGKNKSRAEIAFSRAFSPEVDPLTRTPPVAPDQDAAVEAGEGFSDVLAECRDVREALVLLALRRAEGSVRAAATLLYADFAARVECEIDDEEHAQRVVGESVSRIAARVGGGEVLSPPEDLFADEPEGFGDEDIGESGAESAA